MNQSNGKHDPFAEYDRFTKMGQMASEQVEGDPKQLERYLLMLYDQDNMVATTFNEIQGLEEVNIKHEVEIVSYSHEIQTLIKEKQANEQERGRLTTEYQKSISIQMAEIRRIRGGDYHLLGANANPANKPGFWIGAFILVLLTLYLINFYASVLYNAFILNPVSNDGGPINIETAVSSVTIINLTAFESVFAEFGWIGLIFLISGTFVFIALGFLQHWFTQGQRYWALVGVYTFTFLLDAFLAYEVIHKMHLIKEILDNAKWKVSMAFYDPDFYIILLAGFGMYVAWGLLFMYVLVEYGKILPEITGIRKRRAEIKRLMQDIKEISELKNGIIQQFQQDAEDIQQREVNFRKNELQKNLDKIKELRVKVREYAQRGKKTVQELQTEITFFVSGWLSEVRGRENGQSDIKIEECHKAVEKFYRKIGYN